MSQPTVSILIPMRNEEDFIEACLDSLRAQDYPADRVEILVLDGESTDRSAEVVTRVSAQDPRVHLLTNPGRCQASAMNLGITKATGEIIVRADAHAEYGPTYVSICVAHLVAGRADNVGGLQRGTGTTPFGRAVAAALNTPLGAGNAPYRLATTVRYADTVWLGAWYRKTLQELGGFDVSMVPNEDYELNCRLRESGGRILLDPTLPSRYFARPTPTRLWRQYFRYGRAKVRTLRAHPQTLVLRQLIPPVFVAVLALSVALIPLSPLPVAILGGFYLLIILLGSLKGAHDTGWGSLLFLPFIYLTIHLAWGVGFIWEMFRLRTFPIHLRHLPAAERVVQQGSEDSEKTTV